MSAYALRHVGMAFDGSAGIDHGIWFRSDVDRYRSGAGHRRQLIFCAKRLRKFSKAAGDAITLPQYSSNRFATKFKTLQIICAIIFLICFTVYVASAFVAGTSVFTMIFPRASEQTGMLLCALIIIGYTFLGGFK